ncbi:MAG: phage Gp37/Gp68 family protein [Campylobacterales bacterium]|nr:phage Gp37/Gp68 family protein [Campylobacterales bacterium]
MSTKSKIEWTESTWNPVSGCSKISSGCENCYAERMAKRLQAMGTQGYENGFEVTLHPHALDKPLKMKKPQMIFVNSMSDIFHKDIPDEYIIKIFEVMNQAHWHTFQVLTKRPERLQSIAHKLHWSDNIWMGVTVEANDYVDRVDYLRGINAKVKFLSIEPLIAPVDKLNYSNIDWVIVGGESGYGCRIIKKEWVEDVQKKCKQFNIPFFFKQWGGVNKKKNGRLLNNKIYDELPYVPSPTNLFEIA